MNSATAALWRRPRFWLAQAVWWLVVHAIFVGFDVATNIELFWSVGIVHYLVSCLLAIICSSVLGASYLQIRESWLSGGRAILVVAAGSLLTAVFWNAGVCAHLVQFTKYPVELTQLWAVTGNLQFARVLLPWSVLFLLAHQTQRASTLRERELQSAVRAHRATRDSLKAQLDPTSLLDAIDAVSRAIGDNPETGRARLREVARRLRHSLKTTRSDGRAPVDAAGALAGTELPDVVPASSTAPPAFPLNRRFLFVQGGVGLVMYTTVFAFEGYSALAAGEPARDLLIVHGLGMLLALPCFAALVWVCGRFPRLWRSGGASLGVLVGVCLVSCVPWTLGMALALPMSIELDLSWVGVFDLLHTGTWLLTAWICCLLLTVLGGQLRDARERIVRNEALAHEAQLRSLRAQLHPHFLFNALNSVLPMIRWDPDSARGMLADLKQLMRRAFESARADGTTLEEELDFAAQYLRCEAVRFRGFLSFDIQLPPALQPLAIPSLLLQPLVENAVKHGLVANASTLRIELETSLEGRRLVIEVRNTGKLSEDPRSPAAHADNTADDAAGTGHGAGLRIVRQRIATRYPATGSFELSSRNGWVVARVVYDPNEQPPGLRAEARSTAPATLASASAP